jgi:general secretion pathway protein A
MYEPFFGLSARPFDLTPDHRFLYLTPRHSEALAHLEYGLSGGKGITVLTGEVGTGKTTLLHAALHRAKGIGVLCAHLSNPTLTRAEFYQLLAAEFGLSAAAGESKAQFLLELLPLVRRQHAGGGVSALLVDEAQALSLELLEEIRLLANIETDTDKLLQVVLIGQPELGDRLNEPQLRQLKQRIALRCKLGPMDLRETGAYVAGRIQIAGGEAARIFTREAVLLIYERSRGIPRLVSVICDNALATGFALGKRPIDRQTIVEVCRDFDFSPGPGAVERTPPAEPPPSETPPVEPALVTDMTDSSDSVTPSTAEASDTTAPSRYSLFGSRRLGAHR